MEQRRLLTAALALGGIMAFALPALADDITEIRFGLIPSEDADKLIAESEPLIRAFEEALGMPVKPHVALDYTAVVEALPDGPRDAAGHVEGVERQDPPGIG